MTRQRQASNSGSASTAADRDALVQAAALRLLLIEHPRPLTVDELVRGICRSPVEERGSVERAVRGLGEVELIERRGRSVLPSPAAVRFDQLPID